MAHPLLVSALVAVSVLTGVSVAQNGSPLPVIRISICAPLQADFPVHIVALQYDDHGIHFTFSNGSDKEVVGASLVETYSVPAACARPARGQASMGSFGSYHLRLGPHEKSPLQQQVAVAAAALVGTAWKSEVALQVQFGVVEVDFADGTKWNTFRPRGRNDWPVKPTNRELSHLRG
jgi:hypothetical protein